MVRMAASQIEALCPEVINAARVLAARPRSKVALENMDVFKDAWEKEVRLLTEAVDDITTIDDFLAVSGETWHSTAGLYAGSNYCQSHFFFFWSFIFYPSTTRPPYFYPPIFVFTRPNGWTGL